MTDTIQKQLAYLQERKHHSYRRSLSEKQLVDISAVIQNEDLSLMQRVTQRLKYFLENERVVLLPDGLIHCIRTVESFPDIYTEERWEYIKNTYTVHEFSKVCNIACDYETVIQEGLEGRRIRILNALEYKEDADVEFLHCAIDLIDASEAFVDRYADELIKNGKIEDGETLKRVIRHGADSFLSAMQLFRFLHFILWCAGNYHNTVGRFDQYVFPYYSADIEVGRITEEQALEYIEAFFISFNYDSDLYFGVQQGDNGQSMVLGGCKPDGTDGVNDLTRLCLQASLELKLIDPKINLRVDKNTPLELYVMATELTRVGMGFPQYTNDDVVIPGMIRQGYKPEHARNYTTAACWELIIPGFGMDIPNIGAVSLAALVNNAIRSGLTNANCLDDLICGTEKNIKTELEKIQENVKSIYMEPAPFQSILMADNLDRGRDISEGALYNNYGVHGTGFSCAVDQLAVVDELVFKTAFIEKERLLTALQTNFENDPELRFILRNEAPKLGRDPHVKEIGEKLLDIYAKCFEGMRNDHGGIFKGGTGSAMFYLWHGDILSATADGRCDADPLPANFSPSLFIQDTGLLSVISAFAMKNLVNVINGGPLTIELHDSVFNHADSVEKVAQLVRLFFLQGGHQMQINAVNAEKMREAQEHPELHENMVIRVWGWSGHFIKLDKVYQDQIIARKTFGV